MKKCTLVVKDFCNVKFDGLDPILRKRLVASLKYTDPNAQFSHAFKLKRWDGKIAFFSQGGGTYYNMLPHAIPLIMDEGYEIDVVDERPDFDWEFPEITEEYLADRVWPEGHVLEGEPIMLRDYQVNAANEYFKNWQSMGRIGTGAGKAQPLHSKIKIPSGWKTMGEILVGDVVSTPDGKAANVIGIYPQGIKPIYRITFKDGRSADACGDHLWDIRCMDFKKKDEKGKHVRTLTTDQIAHRLKTMKRPMKVQLPLHETKNNIDLPLDPYVMGVLLGDGGLKNNITISSTDQEILDRVSSRLLNGYELRHKAKCDYGIFMTPDHLRKERRRLKWNDSSKDRKIPNGSANLYKNIIDSLGLSVKSNSKFIPEIYQTASETQKLHLVQGLLDTDGHVGKKGDISFTSVSKLLAEGVVELIRSLGGTASIGSRYTKYTHNGELRQGQLSYTVRIRHRNPKSLLCLTRKLDRISNDYQYNNTLALQIVSVEYIGDHKAQCIMIDHPDHLYITDDYVVTHNTILTAAMSKVVEEVTGGRSIVIVPSKSLVLQTEKDYKNIGLDAGVFYGDRKEIDKTHTICTWQSLAVLNKKGQKRTKAKNGKKWETKSTFDDAFDIHTFLENVTCVIVDEAHGAKAKELKEILCGPMAHIPLRWGMTGTVPKEDFAFAAVLSGIGPVVTEIPAEMLIEKGVLAKCHINVVQMQLKKLVDEFPDWDMERRYLSTNPDLMRWLADFGATVNETGSTLILVENIETGKMLERLIPDSVFVYGNVDTDDRQVEYDKINTSKNIVLIATYGVAAVGISITFLYNVILYNAGKSFTRVIQSIGRGLRKGKSEKVDMEKDSINIFDVTSDLKYSKRHIAARKLFYKEEKYPFTITKVEV